MAKQENFEEEQADTAEQSLLAGRVGFSRSVSSQVSHIMKHHKLCRRTVGAQVTTITSSFIISSPAEEAAASPATADLFLFTLRGWR